MNKTNRSKAQTSITTSNHSSADFHYRKVQLQELAADVLRQARELGASQAVTEFSEGYGLSLTVRHGDLETIEQNRDKGMGITVYLGKRRGHASTSDFSTRALRDTVQAAYDIARFTAEDDCAGLPEPELLATQPPEIALCAPWGIAVNDAIDLAKRCEQAAFATSPLITNSEGASISAQQSHFVMANSLGFSNGYATSRHYISCAPIAGKSDEMQRDDWYSSARNPLQLAKPEAIGRYAAERALARLQPRKLATQSVPVIFEAPLAAGLLGSFVQAISGGALYRKSSFLLDSLGKSVWADHLDVEEDPFQPMALGSAPFDEEGVRVAARKVVDAGVLQGYFLSCYSARKLGMQTTGNAGGAHQLRLTSRLTKSTDDLRALLKKMGRGLLVTELMGQGVNYVTGDYSRGAFGYWVEQGEIAYPVEEFTIAGNLKTMLREIVAVGCDELVRGTKQTGSILIDGMTIAGA